jgi:hypothetical protein
MNIILLLSLFISPYPDGTLIFIINGPYSKLIEKKTGSNISHVAIIFDGFVYEAVRGSGVSKINSADYRRSDCVYIRPNSPISSLLIIRMKRYADSQLGRPYTTRNFIRDKELVGTNCAWGIF